MDLVDCHNRLVQRFESLGQGFSAEFNLKLERIEHLLGLIGNPQNQLRVIHVGGTSGKGTVSTLIASILQKLNIKTGLFTSPYLQVINETCQIDGQMIDVQFMSALLEEVWPAIEQVEAEGNFGRPSYSEVLLAVSLLAFAREKVEVAVVEAFLGGRLDATNVIDSELSVLVSVGLDHIEILGSTIEEIASDKVQIIKPGQLAICGFLQENARKIAQDYADEVGARLRLINRDFYFAYDDIKRLSIITYRGAYDDITTEYEAEFQAHNLLCAVMACEAIIDDFDGEEFQHAIEDAVHEFSLPARQEILCEKPLVIIDGAHNPPKVKACLDVVGLELKEKRAVVLYAAKKATAKNSDVQDLLNQRQRKIYELLTGVEPEAIVCTEFKSKGIWHADDAASLADGFRSVSSHLGIEAITDITKAFSKVQEIAGEEGAVLVIGSFHLAGEIRDMFKSKSQLLFKL